MRQIFRPLVQHLGLDIARAPQLFALEAVTASCSGQFSCRGLQTAVACAQAAEGPSDGSSVPDASPREQSREPVVPPWTPSRERMKRGFLPRRMGHLIQELEQEQAQKALQDRQIPDFDSGDVLEVKLVTPQNQGREAVFKGLCIARYDRAWRTTFRLRNHIANAGAIERTFSLFSPIIRSIRVVEKRKVRRAKLYYLRDRLAKEYRT